MSNQVQWDESYATGDDSLDAQHRELLEECNALAAFVSANPDMDEATFQPQFELMLDLVRRIFAAEQPRLAGSPLIDEHNNEIDEFEFLAADIITAENFDPIEVQRFLSLWCVGHVAGFAQKYREWFGQQADSAS